MGFNSGFKGLNDRQ